MNKQLLASAVSFAASVAIWYLLTGSLVLVIGFFLLILVHEMGHFAAARQKGIAVSLPMFSPLGAAVQIEGTNNAADEAYIAMAGPLVGGIVSAVVMVLALMLNSMQLMQIGYIGILLNAFNLIPVSPLDGGRISMVLNRRLWILGIPALLYLLWTFGLNPINILIAVFILSAAVSDVKRREMQAVQQPQYFAVKTSTRVAYGLIYVVLAGALGWICFDQTGFIQLLIALGL